VELLQEVGRAHVGGRLLGEPEREGGFRSAHGLAFLAASIASA
jgi:hypothetical protein